MRRDCEPHRAGLILTLGIISLASLVFCALLGLPFGIVAWTLGQRDLKKMKANIMDPQGMGMTQAGKVCGIVGTIICSLYGLLCVGYIVFMVTMASITSYGSAPGRPGSSWVATSRTFQMQTGPVKEKDHLP